MCFACLLFISVIAVYLSHLGRPSFYTCYILFFTTLVTLELFAELFYELTGYLIFVHLFIVSGPDSVQWIMLAIR